MIVDVNLIDDCLLILKTELLNYVCVSLNVVKQYFFEIKIDLPVLGVITKSGSIAFVKLKLKSRKPLKTDNTTKRAIVPATTPNEAIMVIILIAEFLLKLIA